MLSSTLSLTLLSLSADPVAPDVATIREPIPATTSATSPGHPDAPRRLAPGSGLLISAGILGAGGLTLKILGTVFDAQELYRIQTGQRDPNECIESCFSGWVYNSMGAAMLVPSMALAGGGMHKRMRAEGEDDLTRGRSRLRRAYVFTGVGYGLLLTGTATFTALQVSKWFAPAEAWVGMTEAAWWLGLAQGYAGATLAGWGDGYRRGFHHPRVTYAVTPVASSRWTGIAISGRF